jgi:arylsulfatase A-like enzyme
VPQTRSHSLCSSLAAALLVVACGNRDGSEQSQHLQATGSVSAETAPRSRKIDLLRRAPDEVTEQTGVLVPSPAGQWGSHGLDGWEGYTTHDGSGRPGVWAKRSEASLRLPVARLRDRTLELIAWVAEPGEHEPAEQRVELVLNDRSLGTVVLRTAPTEVRISAPRDHWVLGDNHLVLRVPHTRKGWNGEPLGVGLAQVDYGATRRVAHDPQGRHLQLQPFSGLRYRIEGVPGGRLAIHGTTGARDGGVILTLRRFDALTVQTMALGGPLEIPARGGVLETTVPLAQDPGQILEVELCWRAEDGASTGLELDRLEILDVLQHDLPPIVLISLDTVAARNLSVYGYPRKTSPRLEELACEAVVFERCLANSTWTVPSHMALMTGLHAGVHARHPVLEPGVEPDLSEMWQLDERRWTLAEALRAAGYRTGGFVDSLWLSGRLAFDQGFELYDDSAARIELDRTEGGIEHVSALALSWLAEPDERPPFLFLHCFDAHGPYTVPEPWKGQLAGRTISQPLSSAFAGVLDRCFGGIHSYIAAPYANSDGIPKRLPTDPIADAYDEGLLALDARLGAFMDRLRESGLWDEAVVIVTSDHGESMTEHDFFFAHGMAYDSVLRVPLLVKLPRGEQGGRRIAQGVQLVDLYSTILELAGLDPSNRGRHGRSLAPALRGQELAPAALFAQGGLMQQATLEYGRWKLLAYDPTRESDLATVLSFPGVPRDWRNQHVPELEDSALTLDLFEAIRADPERSARLWNALVELVGRPHYELYDMRSDLGERTNLAAAHPEIIAELVNRLGGELRRVEQTRARLSTQRPMRALTGEDRAALDALGYSGR